MVFFWLALAAGIATPAWAESPLASGARYLSETYPRRLWSIARETYTGGSLGALTIAGGLVPVFDGYDGEFQEEIREERPLGDFVDAGEAIGSPPVLFGVPLVLAMAGSAIDSDVIRATGTLMLEALSIAGLSTITLKLAVGRRRPDGSNDLSFPSNHASGSFTLATIAASRHGWTAGVPAFLLAGFVSATRLEADKHFLTDTLFGAVLGTIVGFSALQVEAGEKDAGAAQTARRPSWTPVSFAVRDGGGLGVLVKW
jgi:PAP2 superfamily.